MKFCKAAFSVGREGFYPINMGVSPGEFIDSMMDPEVLFIAHID